MIAARTIRLRRLRLDARVGVLPHELTSPQPLLIDVELTTHKAQLNPQAERLAEVLDYRQVRETAIRVSLSKHWNLVEALVDQLALELLKLDTIVAVRVAVYKPQAFDDCDEVGVEVFVQREASQR